MSELEEIDALMEDCPDITKAEWTRALTEIDVMIEKMTPFTVH